MSNRYADGYRNTANEASPDSFATSLPRLGDLNPSGFGEKRAPIQARRPIPRIFAYELHP